MIAADGLPLIRKVFPWSRRDRAARAGALMLSFEESILVLLVSNVFSNGIESNQLISLKEFKLIMY